MAKTFKIDAGKKVDIKIAKYAQEHDMTYQQAKAWLKEEGDNGQGDAEIDGKSEF